jgi:electron transport complex protein RnfG
MKETLRLILTLTAICVLSGALLALVNGMTAEPIEQARRAEQTAALKRVLPPADNDPLRDTVTIEEAGRAWTFYVARADGAFAGAAFETVTSMGYGGNIVIIVGVTADGTVQGIQILEQKETPGLGAKITEESFLAQFAGRSATETTWAVSKDQGDIDQITAATISSRAVVAAVREGIDVYLRHAAAIRGAEPRGEA